MKREEIIKELSQYAHPSWFQKLLTWPTKALEKLLNYYVKGEMIDRKIREIMNDEKVGEPLKNVMKFKK